MSFLIWTNNKTNVILMLSSWIRVKILGRFYLTGKESMDIVSLEEGIWRFSKISECYL